MAEARRPGSPAGRRPAGAFAFRGSPRRTSFRLAPSRHRCSPVILLRTPARRSSSPYSRVRASFPARRASRVAASFFRLGSFIAAASRRAASRCGNAAADSAADRRSCVVAPAGRGGSLALRAVVFSLPCQASTRKLRVRWSFLLLAPGRRLLIHYNVQAPPAAVG